MDQAMKLYHEELEKTVSQSEILEYFVDLAEVVNMLRERKEREGELWEERVEYEQLCRGEVKHDYV